MWSELSSYEAMKQASGPRKKKRLYFYKVVGQSVSSPICEGATTRTKYVRRFLKIMISNLPTYKNLITPSYVLCRITCSVLYKLILLCQKYVFNKLLQHFGFISYLSILLP
jgi:hypothetical protein